VLHQLPFQNSDKIEFLKNEKREVSFTKTSLLLVTYVGHGGSVVSSVPCVRRVAELSPKEN